MKGRIWIWNILALICLTACDRWFDVNPQTEVKQKELFSTDQGFYNALMGVYLNLSDPELYGGELQFGLVDVLAQTYSISNTTGGGSAYLYAVSYDWNNCKTLCFTSFFTLTNPLGTMPVFLTMTNGLEEKERQHIVKRATIISFIILIAFTFCGQFLFKFFGISTNGFRIAAGIIILKIGYDMLQARYTNTKLKDEEIKAYANDISITPLSIPMLCGPGAIANGIIMMDDARTWGLKVTLVSVIALVYILTYIILRLSTKLVRIIGETGNNVMMRLMGLILMVIAVECFVGGMRPILIDIIQGSRL